MASRILWGLRAYLLLVSMWVRVSLSYRTSFAILTVANFFITGLDFLAIVVMFASVDRLGGFDLPEIAFLYGGTAVAIGIADLLLGNIDRLGTRIRMGTFDAMMVRPIPLYVQAGADEFTLRRLGRVAQGTFVLIWSIVVLPVDWTLARVLMVPYLIVFGTLIFLALFTLGAAFQFWSTDGSEVANAFTYGGNTMTQYPLTIFPGEVVRVLTFLVPVGFVNWYPSLFILGRPDPFGLPEVFQFASPVAAGLLCLLAAVAWRTGVRRYQSTGS